MSSDMWLVVALGAALILGIIYACLVAPVFSRRKFLKRNRRQFGMPPTKREGLIAAEHFWDSWQQVRPQDLEGCIDDITWGDLDMDEVFHRVNACQTCVGDARLYALLRRPGADTEAVLQREALMTLFENNPKLREDVQVNLNGMGRTGGYALDMLCFHPQTMQLTYRPLYRLLAFLPLAGVLLAILSPTLGLVTVSCALVVNIVVMMLYKARHENQFTAMRYFASLVSHTRRMARLLAPHDEAVAQRLQEAAQPFNKVTKSITVLTINHLFTDAMGIICPLTPFMLPLLSYGKLAQTLVELQEKVRLLYQQVGDVDAALALLSYRISLEQYAQPQFIEESCVTFTDLYHPLLDDAVTNSASYHNDVVITGSNASGKSTYLKAIAINCIFAQTIHTCTAGSFALRRGCVGTSMAVADSIVQGDSYFIAEIKSMRRLLLMAQQQFGYFFIDEILRGTNTVERIAAASEVIAYLHTKDCLCFAATHDIELTVILDGLCDNIHFRETVSAEGVHFDYQVQPGPTTSRNALALLSHLDFPHAICDGAARRSSYFEENGSWTAP